MGWFFRRGSSNFPVRKSLAVTRMTTSKSALHGIRTSGAIFHGARGHFVMAAYCEGGMEPGGTGRESEGNVLIGKLGYAAWRALAAPEPKP